MIPNPSLQRLLLATLVALTTLVAATQATAQYGVGLELPRRNFVAGEVITATVTIANRSGADVFLDAPGQKRWLSFKISNTQGRDFPPLDVGGEGSFILKAGSTVAKKVQLTDNFALSEIGTYAITASVFHPASGQYYESNRAHFTLVGASEIWKQSVGVPEGSKLAGRIHSVAILIHRDTDSTSLYTQVTDERSGLPVITYQLGPASLVLEPQIKIDADNQVHVFFLASPNIFCHSVIAPDGELKKRVYYRELDDDRPTMITDGTGKIAIVGGSYFDPSAAAAASKSNPGGLPSTGPGRSVSDRPPGL